MPDRLPDALVVLTRPQGRNESMAQHLADLGLEPLCMPALEIVPVASDAVPQPGDFDLIVFVSGNAVCCYFQQLVQAGLTPAWWPAHTQVAVVGAATAQAVAQSGLVPAGLVLCPDAADEQDSESLWKVLQPRIAAPCRALIVRGQSGREWLGQQLEQAGVQVHRHTVYQRRALPWPAVAQERLQQGVASGRLVICLLTSAHSVQAFLDNAAKQGFLPSCAGFHYVVIHPRIRGRLQSSLNEASGKVEPLAVTICPPRDDAILQTVISVASL